MTTITDEMVDAFDIAFLELYYPDRHDFIASQGRQRDAVVAGLKAALSALPDAGEGAGQSTLAAGNSATPSASRRGEPAPDRNAVIEECAKAIGGFISDFDNYADGKLKDALAAIRALKSPANPSAESKVMPNRPQPTEQGASRAHDATPHPHPSANADAGGAQIELVARLMCKQEGYHHPNEDWTRFTNGEENSVIPDVAIPDGEKQRWRCYAWRAKAIINLLQFPQPPDGWVMVLGAALDEHDNEHGVFKDAYMPNHWTHSARRLLAAAPKPQVPGGE